MDDTRARFIAAISARLGADRIVELHLFSPIRQGQLETGVAVVAVTPGGEEIPEAAETPDAAPAPDEPIEQAPELEVPNAEVVPTAPVPPPILSESADGRLVVHTARYRLTRKGPDRGKWLFEVTATADAPLATVDAVARGVTQRSKDLTESERFSGDELRVLLQDPQWRTPT